MKDNNSPTVRTIDPAVSAAAREMVRRSWEKTDDRAARTAAAREASLKSRQKAARRNR